MNSLEYLGAIGVGKGWMISYRHMCRWNSGFFYKHPRLKDFDWYWRVEPDVRVLPSKSFQPGIPWSIFNPFLRSITVRYSLKAGIAFANSRRFF